MADTAPAPVPPVVPDPRSWAVAIARLIGLFALAMIGVFAIALLVLDSPLGHRLVTDRIAALRLQSGLII